MVKRKPIALVIDADVACNAGDKSLPIAERCRNLFNSVKDLNYHIVISQDIWGEWQDHASSRSRKWLLGMTARKRVVNVGDARNAVLRQKIRNTLEKSSEKDHAERDCHLLEAALATDKIVFSCDENTARKLFRQAAVTVAEIRPILWANPDLPEDDGVAWLQRGAPNEAKRRLDYIRQNPK